MNIEKVQRGLVLVTEGLQWPADIERDLLKAHDALGDELETALTLDMVRATLVYVDGCVARIRVMLAGTEALQTGLRAVLLKRSDPQGPPS